MIAEKKITAAILIAFCLIAVVLGLTGGHILRTDADTVAISGNVDKLTLPAELLSTEHKHVINELNQSYPDNIVIENEEITLIGSDTIIAFDEMSAKLGISYMWETVPITEGYVVAEGYAVPIGEEYGEGIILSDEQMYNFYLLEDEYYESTIVMTPDELELLLKGDEQTKEMFWELLNATRMTDEELGYYEIDQEEHHSSDAYTEMNTDGTVY